MNNQLVIVGASGHGKVVVDIAKKIGGYQSFLFLDDNIEIKEIMGIPVVGSCLEVEKYIGSSDIFVAIGNVDIRKRIMKDLLEKKANIPILIHPQATIGMNVEIGLGTVIMAGTVINPDTQIGIGCIVNTGASVDHDCMLGDYVHVAVGAHLAGNVCIGDNTWVGAGVVISNNVSVCDNVLLGAGAVVVKDIKEQGIYVGVPATRM